MATNKMKSYLSPKTIWLIISVVFGVQLLSGLHIEYTNKDGVVFEYKSGNFGAVLQAVGVAGSAILAATHQDNSSNN